MYSHSEVCVYNFDGLTGERAIVVMMGFGEYQLTA